MKYRKNSPQGRLRENSNSARSLHPSREKRSEEYRVKRTTEPLRHAAAEAIGMFYEICGISRSPGKERTAFRTTSSEITVHASETRINMGQYGCRLRNVILRYIFRVSTPTPFNFYSRLGRV